MGKRSLPPGVSCRPIMISIAPADHLALRRRVALARAGGEPSASVSGEIRKAVRGDRRRRQDLRQSLEGLALAERAFRAAAIDTPMLLAVIRKALGDMGEILAEPV